MHHAGLGEGLVDGQLRGHDGVVGGGEHGLDPGSHQGFGSHLHLGGGGAVLFNVLDALFVAESLGIGDGLRGGILTQVIQQTDGVDLRVCGKDQVHDGGGVQGVGGAGHVLAAVKACSSGVGDGGVHHRDLGIFHSGQHGGGGGGGHSHDHVHAIGHQVGADLVQVALVGLRVGVVISVVKGDALFLAQLVQTALHGCHDLVEGSMIHIVDDAHLEGLTGHGAGSGLGGSGCTGCGAGGGRRCAAAAGQSQRGNGGSGHSGLQEAAAGDHVHGFHSG